MRSLPDNDREWNRHYGPELISLAVLHFSDLDAATAASDFLAAGPHAHRGIIDLGAGAGKFVLAAAGRHSEVSWVGVDLSEEVLREAKTWKTRHALSNTRFFQADLLSVKLSDYGGAYIFNPFGGFLDPEASGRISAVGRDLEAFRNSVLALRQNLRDVPTGFRLVTYYCEESQVPEEYERVWEEGKLVGYEK